MRRIVDKDAELQASVRGCMYCHTLSSFIGDANFASTCFLSRAQLCHVSLRNLPCLTLPTSIAPAWTHGSEAASAAAAAAGDPAESH